MCSKENQPAGCLAWPWERLHEGGSPVDPGFAKLHDHGGLAVLGRLGLFPSAL